MKRWVGVALTALLCPPLPAAPALADDFEREPLATGWTAPPRALAWPADPAHGHSLQVLRDCATSPRFPVAPGQLYRVRFTARAGAGAMWALNFYDVKGQLLPFDHYDAIEPSADWRTQEFWASTKYPAVSAAVVIDAGWYGAVLVDDLSVEPITAAQADAITAALEQTLPPITVPAVPGLAATRAKLAKGEPVRVVLFGDSIANDLSNSPLPTLLRRAYPKAQVELRFTGRGGTGFAVHQENVRRDVLDHEPDLLVLLAISNDNIRTLDPALQRIIDETKAARPQTEILLVTPHVEAIFTARSRSNGRAQREVLRAVAARNNLPLVDLLAVWEGYQQATGKPQSWLMRDIIHMNARGRLLTAHAVAGALLPANK